MLVRSTIASRIAERRTALRYPLRLPVVFSWQDEGGRIQGSDGYCRDLGSRGIYVHSQLVPPLGVAVEMNVFLPRPEHSVRPSEIHAVGRVVRSEPLASEQSCGFAAMNHTTLLRETRTQQAVTQDPALSEFGMEEAEDESGRTPSE
jgi:hypothetical protein